jgi:hypothetical protein
MRMTYDPLDQVTDEPLHVDAAVVAGLRAYRDAPKLTYLPGENVIEERRRLEDALNDLVDRLLDGIEQHPSKRWVLMQFQALLAAMEGEDTEARDHVGAELESIMDVLGIDSSDGLLGFYLGGL